MSPVDQVSARKHQLCVCGAVIAHSHIQHVSVNLTKFECKRLTKLMLCQPCCISLAESPLTCRPATALGNAVQLESHRSANGFSSEQAH